ncbi:D-amino-acid transaminase [Diplonema papillatum]|nr:D-amino-acid transaminase [Diplonema papillatum]KAJ9461249.1 D-amino-acid transaminase [Diplonema papillatum]
MKVLSREDYLDSMRDVRKEINPDGPSAVAMYSSLVDGVVTDPELMLLPVDDHMAARGHGVFDMCTLRNGWLYRLAAHLDRLLDSAESAKLEFPYPGGRAENARKMTEVISGTVSACSVRDAPIRYFLSAGPGNFAFGPAGCRTAFYVVVQGKSSIRDLAEGVPEVFVRSVPLKTMPFVKSNNYMINTLVYMSAREQGGSFGLTLDEDGMLVESCNLTPILVVNSTLVTPLSGRGTNALRSMTQLRVFELAKAGVLAPGVSAFTSPHHSGSKQLRRVFLSIPRATSRGLHSLKSFRGCQKVAAVQFFFFREKIPRRYSCPAGLTLHVWNVWISTS